MPCKKKLTNPSLNGVRLRISHGCNYTYFDFHRMEFGWGKQKRIISGNNFREQHAQKRQGMVMIYMRRYSFSFSLRYKLPLHEILVALSLPCGPQLVANMSGLWPSQSGLLELTSSCLSRIFTASHLSYGSKRVQCSAVIIQLIGVNLVPLM